MVTYAYTGRLTDFGEAPFPNAVPELSVVAPASFGPGGVTVAERDVPVPVASNGAFTVNLIASIDLIPPRRYVLKCDWFTVDQAGQKVLGGWSTWEFTAQIGGGSITDMADAVLTRFWWDDNPPPVERAGIIWIHRMTGDVLLWEG